MKYVIIMSLMSLSLFAVDKKKDVKTLTPLEQRIERLRQQVEHRANMRASIPYFKFKYEKIAKEKLQDLEKEQKRYEAGLAKLQKGTKKYAARSKEYQDILNKIKAQKIILVYAKHFEESLDAYDNKNSELYAEKSKICSELTNKYTEYTNEAFPNFLGEYLMIKDRKKNRLGKKRQASTQ